MPLILSQLQQFDKLIRDPHLQSYKHRRWRYLKVFHDRLLLFRRKACNIPMRGNMKNKKILLLLAVSIVLSADAFGRQDDAGEKGVRTIYLVRHGQYDHADARDEFNGKGLVPLGIAQARLLAARLRAMPVEFTSLTSSTMTRARQTAQVIHREFPRLELKPSELICECTPPTWRKDVMA
jgi:hypothetical protein